MAVELAILWHMHQPVYLDPATGTPVLPWVRLHAARSYYDMAKVLARHGGARVHVNFVPALLDQLDAATTGTRDRFLDMTERPAADLSAAEREWILANFFSVDPETQIRPLPRYRELLVRRGEDGRRADVSRAARTFSAGELRDLQVLFNLAWTGFSLREEDPALRALLAKGRGFTEADKEAVLASHSRAVAAIVPLWRALSEAGQVELTATPYYHPILPLLVDSDCASEALPGHPLPERFAHPEDAREQVRRARDSHARRFGHAPSGMWPAEGAISRAAAGVFAAAGTNWIASDEGVLFRSLPAETPRSALYHPWRLSTDGGEIDIVFRDRTLSDLVGFAYQKAPPREAVADFLARVAAIGAGEAPLACVILDGENPWEHYPESGREFLDRLYDGIEAGERGVTPVLLSRRLARGDAQPLPRLHAGSWIEASFRIWMGHAEDRAAWNLLRGVRAKWEAARAAGLPADRLQEAYDQILIAEGSDWFWWFGDDFTTENAAEFDGLFRGRLSAACRLLGVQPPQQLSAPISGQASRRAADGGNPRPPEALLHPAIDGRVTVFGEWTGAGEASGVSPLSSMARTEPFIRLRWGFDLENLFLRMDPAPPGPQAGAAADGIELLVEGPLGSRTVRFSLRRGPPGPEVTGSPAAGESAFEEIFEARVPLSTLGARAGDTLHLQVRAFDGAIEVQRLPAGGAIATEVPGPDFEGVHWRV